MNRNRSVSNRELLQTDDKITNKSRNFQRSKSEGTSHFLDNELPLNEINKISSRKLTKRKSSRIFILSRDNSKEYSNSNTNNVK